MKFFAIVLACVGLSIAYGIAHDNITARLCIEYFTVGHPIIIDTTDPTLIALLWGVIATWWVGTALGILVALGARVGKLPKLELRDLFWPMLVLIVAMGCFAAFAGTVAYFMFRQQPVSLPRYLAARIPENHQLWFVVDLWTHNASYLAGIIGAIVLSIYSIKLRWKRYLAEQLGASEPR